MFKVIPVATGSRLEVVLGTELVLTDELLVVVDDDGSDVDGSSLLLVVGNVEVTSLE